MGLMRKGLQWGDLRGLIRITGAEALEDFGFTTKPGAEGIMFRKYTYVTSGGKRTTGIFINNYMPRVQPHTPAQTAVWNTFATLSNIVNSNRTTFYPIWQPLAEKRHYHKALWGNEFRGVNMKLVGTPPDWTKMLLSDGLLEPTPQITGIFLMIPPGIRMTFDSSTYQNGEPLDIVHGAIYSPVIDKFEILQDTKVWRRQDQEYRGFSSILYKIPQSIGYIFFSRDCMYSPSVSLHG